MPISQIIFIVISLIVLFFVLRKILRIKRYVSKCYQLKKVAIKHYGKQNGTQFYKYIKNLPKLKKKEKL